MRWLEQDLSCCLAAAMAKKKRRLPAAFRASPSGTFKQEQDEELVALEAIYADAFTRDPDSRGFSLTVVPHPGLVEDNHVR
ncbi:uncharacterized protein HaLaN_05012, partial [Haematococcus lacustris]